MSEITKVQNQGSKTDKPRVVMLCPGVDTKIQSEIPIQLVTNVYEVCAVLQSFDGPVVMAVSEPILVKMLVEYQTEFEIEATALVGVPGCVYDAFFEQYIWSLERVSYDALILEAANIAKLEALKAAERPKMSGNVSMPKTVEEVKRLRAPRGYVVQRDENLDDVEDDLGEELDK